MHSNLSRSIAYIALSGFIFLDTGCSRPETVVMEPRETDQVLVNPGMGFTTFYSFNGDSINAGCPQCSIAYFRWYWDDLEPEDGEIDFAMIDSLIAVAGERGQKIAFRVMCQNGHETADKRENDYTEVPGWLRRLGVKGFLYPDGRHWQPDYDDPVFLERHLRLIRALGSRYDGRPEVDHVDIGSVGHWGEWHSTVGPLPTVEHMKLIVDTYLESFRHTPLVMNIDGTGVLEYAVANGTGWRADCLGDMRATSPGRNWDHMSVAYPNSIRDYNLGDAWKRAPVVFETCWNMLHWEEEGWDVDWIFDKALQWHISVLNNKSFPVPENWRPKVDQLQKRMGYRFVLARLSHPDRASAGLSLRLDLDWINRGVAPCYRKYVLAIGLQKEPAGEMRILETDLDVTRWLPGVHKLWPEVTLPADLPPGKYGLLLALLDPQNRTPAVRLAIEGRRDDGWYAVSRIRID